MKIIIGADHAGFRLKGRLKNYLRKKGHTVIDEGARSLKGSDDYPDYGFKVAKRVVKEDALGILVCGSAAGVCIAANKVRGVRSVAASTKRDAFFARTDDHANVLCLSGRWWSWWRVKNVVNVFLSTPYSLAPRHCRRVKKIVRFESRR